MATRGIAEDHSMLIYAHVYVLRQTMEVECRGHDELRGIPVRGMRAKEHKMKGRDRRKH